MHRNNGYSVTTVKKGIRKMSAGDISWVITATALVMLMTPALGFFYGGLVRRKNLVSTIVQCLVIFAVVSITWALWGYSLVFGPSVHGVIGDLSLVGLFKVGIHDVDPAISSSIPTLLYFAFQLEIRSYNTSLDRRRVCRENQIPLALDFYRALVYAYLRADSPLGMES